MRFKTAILLAAAALTLGACSQVDDNEIGLVRKYGEIQNTPVRGLQWYNPFSTDIITFDNAQQKIPVEATVSTHDQQRAHIKAVAIVQLSRNGAADMYRNRGADWAPQFVPSIVLSTQNSEFGKISAVQAIQQQAALEQAIQAQLSQRFAKQGIIMAGYQLIEVKFSDDYMNAVEQKATATQNAEAEKNKTAAIREVGEQKKITAIAEAEAMRVKAEALRTDPSLIEYERLAVQRDAIKKWDGSVPGTVMGGQGAGIPFVNVPLNGK